MDDLVFLGLSVIATIVLGILSGLYSGLVVSRAAQFNELIREAERPLKRFDCMEEDGKVIFRFSTDDLRAIGFAAADLAANGHVQASVAVTAVEREINDAILKAKGGRFSYVDLENAALVLRHRLGALRPTRLAIYSPFAAP